MTWSLRFTRPPTSSLPDLTPGRRSCCSARTLWREGYNDHLAGHITYNLGDGTLLCNPWLLTWDEIRPRDIIRIDLDGNVLEGDWPAPLGIPLHLELHKARHDVQVAMHNHPLYGTVWSDIARCRRRVRPELRLGGGGDLVLVDEYDGGGQQHRGRAASAVDGMGDAELALLAGHGVFVLGSTVTGRAPARRRARAALPARLARARRGRQLDTPVPRWWIDRIRHSDGNGFLGFWEAMVRQELRADPELLDAVTASLTTSG